jgi:hypothetical protein
MKMNNQKGQALLLAIVAIAAVLVVSLSVVSRSVTDVRTTANQEDSVRAFSAAESGIERALLTGATGTITASDLENASYSASVTKFAEGQTEIIHPRKPLSGDDVTIWLMSHDSNGDLTCSPNCYTGRTLEVCWGTSPDTDPAVQVSVVYDPSNVNNIDNISIARKGYDPNAGRRATNFFLNPGSCSFGSFAYGVTIDFQNDFPTLGIPYGTAQTLKMLKIRPLYNIAQAYPIGVKAAAGQVFPGQGKEVESTGTSGDATRKIKVYTLYPELPFVFDSTVFSMGGISQ